MPKATTKEAAFRNLALAFFWLALIGVARTVVYQYRSVVNTVEVIAHQRFGTLAELVETEVANVAQFGPYRRERLERLFQDLVEHQAVGYLRLEDETGRTLVSAGRLTTGGKVAFSGERQIKVGNDIVIWRKITIRKQFGEAHGSFAISPSVGGPIGNPSGLISGRVRLVLSFPGDWLTNEQRNALIQMLVSLVLVFSFAVSAMLILRATKRRETAEGQMRLAEQRNRYLEGINLMASGLAHEIKNPIGAVRGFTQLLAEQLPQDSGESRYTQLMIESLDEVNERVSRLLWFGGPRATERTKVNLDDLVRDVLRLIEPDTMLKRVKVETRLEGHPPLAMVDKSEFKEILINLLINALDAVRDRGTVRVETRYLKDKAEHLLVVRDNGSGIAPKDAENVFRPYYTTKSKGSGLGLSICLRNVENHGGAIRMESTVGKGTVVTATFPREQEQ